MTRILIASLNYAPEETGIAPYSTKLAEHLARQGYRVSAVTGMPHYPAWKVAPEYAGKTSAVEIINGVEVHRRAHYVPASQSALRRARYEATSLMMGVEAMRLERPDAVIGVLPSLSAGIVARAAARRFGVPYALIFQDLVGLAAEQSGMRGGGRVTGVVKALEGWAARGASAVGVIAEGFRPYVESLGVDAAKIRRIRNWTHAGEVTVERDAMRTWLGWPQHATVCLHAGNMGFKQGLENLIDAARVAQGAGVPVLFAMMGDGNQRAALDARAKRLALTNVSFMPLQANEVFPSVLAAADMLLVNQRGTVTDMSLPSKLTAYFAAGRPVVAAVAAQSEAAREIVASGGGLCVQPDEPAALFDAIVRVAADRGLALHLGRRGREWAATTLSEATSLRAYEQLVATVLVTGKHGRVHTPLRNAPRREPDAIDAAAADDPAERSERWAA